MPGQVGRSCPRGRGELLARCGSDLSVLSDRCSRVGPLAEADDEPAGTLSEGEASPATGHRDGSERARRRGALVLARKTRDSTTASDASESGVRMREKDHTLPTLACCWISSQACPVNGKTRLSPFLVLWSVMTCRWKSTSRQWSVRISILRAPVDRANTTAG